MSALEDALAAGLGYLFSLQAEDGSWTEWALPPGPSSAWTTAYIGYKLRGMPRRWSATLEPHLVAAARWQLAHACAEGGWGYNERVGPDADSTAHAILFLASRHQPVPDAAYALLAGLQRPDGGFATYPPFGEPDTWSLSHPDVTPIALLAMRTQPAPDHALLARGLDYVLRQKTPQGLWHSFWWRSDLYATEANLALLNALRIAPPPVTGLMQITPANAFEAALLVSSLLLIAEAGTQEVVREQVGQLIRQQCADGSWHTAPILRVTRRDCAAPWASGAPGQLYAEPHKLFTTVTVLHALISAIS
jgi:squalene cyclase